MLSDFPESCDNTKLRQKSHTGATGIADNLLAKLNDNHYYLEINPERIVAMAASESESEQEE